MSEFCSWVTPIAFLFAGIIGVVLAVGIHGEDKNLTLVAAPLFLTASFVGVLCYWGVLG
jgi:hypothetical protein